MIARNFRRYPEAMALQLCLELVCVVVRKVQARHTAYKARARASIPIPAEAEDIPIGAKVRTPTGKLAEVIGYRGAVGRRDGGPGVEHRVRLVCQYLNPENKRFDKVLLVPELVTIVEKEGAT